MNCRYVEESAKPATTLFAAADLATDAVSMVETGQKSPTAGRTAKFDKPQATADITTMGYGPTRRNQGPPSSAPPPSGSYAPPARTCCR